jgi:alpha-1,2-rhamnosyltransferase
MSFFLNRFIALLFSAGNLIMSVADAVISRLAVFIDYRRLKECNITEDDVLILLDASWYSDLSKFFEKLKAKRIHVVFVIYDLIPLAHPEFCTERSVRLFTDWFEWVAETADGFMSISQATMDQLRKNLLNTTNRSKLQERWFDYFHLGSELDLAEKGGFIRDKVKEPFENAFPSYLMVGTIEPRKNHDYLLDAFDILWAAGYKINLVFVGRTGWKCQHLIKKIKNHHLLNRQLFLFNDLNDTELEFCYKNSRCLLFPSFVEGFGLPLVEAMQRGIPAMVSDIAVFREIGGDFVAYFDPYKPETILNLINGFEKNGKLLSAKKLSDWSWPNWEDATRQFLSKILLNVNAQRQSERSA